jgi:hypothetical protein
MSPLLLFFLGGWAGSAVMVREFEVAAAIDVRASLNQTGVVRVSTRAGLSGFWKEIGSAKITARDFAADGLPLFTEPERPKSGILHRLVLDLSNFRLSNLPIKRLTAQIPNCRFDANLAIAKKRIRLSQAGTGLGVVEIETYGLEQYVLANVSEIKRVAIAFENDRIQVAGYGEFLVVSTEFRIDAKLEVQSENKLVLSDARIWFDGRPADQLSSESLLRALNPVVDLDRDLNLFGAIKIQRLRFKPNALTAEGAATIPIRPKEKT